MKVIILTALTLFISFIGADDLQEDDVPGPPLSEEEFEADITGLEDTEEMRTECSVIDKEFERTALINTKEHWPNGVVPYLIAGNINSNERKIIAKAMRDYHDLTCIRFVPRTSQADYIHIRKKGGCYSRIGKAGGSQTVSLGRGCFHKKIVMHEFMHAIGFHHEQTRSDRDEYLDVDFSNIKKGNQHNFGKVDEADFSNLNTIYDYCSIMQYASWGFAIDRKKPTMIPKKWSPCGKTLGQYIGFSRVDLMKINTLYKCAGREQTSSTACSNKNSNCEKYAKEFMCFSIKKDLRWMMSSCQKACKQCSKSGVTGGGGGNGNSCKNNHVRCDVWTKAGYCTMHYIRFMTKNCKKSCGLCCKNLLSEKNCSYFSRILRLCEKYPTFMNYQCKKTCKKC